MKGVVFPGDRTVSYIDVADPGPGPLDVVIEMKASGMCGTDLPELSPSERSAAVHAAAHRPAADRGP